MAEAVEVIRAGLLDGLPHGFLGRRGGVSGGVTAGLDMGLRGMDLADPALAEVRENRRRGAEAVLPGARVVRAEGSYLYAQARTPWLKFTDDLEFWANPTTSGQPRRSASRNGNMPEPSPVSA